MPDQKQGADPSLFGPSSEDSRSEGFADGLKRYGPILLILLLGGGLLWFLLSQSGTPPAEVSQTAPDSAADEPIGLSIMSKPLGATVFIDGDSIGQTPLREYALTPGLYVVSVRAEPGVSTDTLISLERNDPAFFFFTLRDAAAPLPGMEEETGPAIAQRPIPPADRRGPSSETARRTPPPAADERTPPAQTDRPRGGDATAQTEDAAPQPEPADPAETNPAETGPAEEVAQAAEDMTREDEAQEDGAQAETGETARTGDLLVTSEPSGATVWLDRERVGQTPLILRDLAPGEKEIVFSVDSQAPYVTNAQVEADQLQSVQASLATRSEEQETTVLTDNEPSADDEPPAPGDAAPPADDGAKEPGAEEQGAGDQETAQEQVTADGARGEDASEENAPGENNAVGEGTPDEGADRALVRDGVYLAAEQPPRLLGGLQRLQRRVQYPAEAYREGVEGRVYVQFVVDEDGQVQDPEVLEGLPHGANEEALRVIQQANFRPGEVNGSPVSVRHALYLTFEIL